MIPCVISISCSSHHDNHLRLALDAKLRSVLCCGFGPPGAELEIAVVYFIKDAYELTEIWGGGDSLYVSAGLEIHISWDGAEPCIIDCHIRSKFFEGYLC